MKADRPHGAGHLDVPHRNFMGPGRINYVILKNERERGAQVDFDRLPRHVAIIMDGNGRWAKRKGLPRSYGHRAGADTLKRIVIAADDLGIKVLTVYAFSTENWKRLMKKCRTS